MLVDQNLWKFPLLRTTCLTNNFTEYKIYIFISFLSWAKIFHSFSNLKKLNQACVYCEEYVDLDRFCLLSLAFVNVLVINIWTLSIFPKALKLNPNFFAISYYFLLQDIYEPCPKLVSIPFIDGVTCAIFTAIYFCHCCGPC